MTDQPALPPVDDRPQLIDRAVKMLRLRQNLAQVQGRLRPSQQAFSKFIHHPLVSRISTAVAISIGRPAGLLGGALTAFLGSLIYLYLALHIGFEYNYLLFLLFFVVGFVLGIGGEYLSYLLRRLSSRRTSKP